MKSEAKKIIQQLIQGNFIIECPDCREEFKASNAGLFALDELTPEAEEIFEEKKEELREWEAGLRDERKKISKRSETTTKAVNIGFISERLAPVLPEFKFENTDCRSLFDPIDYVIFEGLTKKGIVTKMLFVDIKTGNAKLNRPQKQIKEAVEKKKVGFDVYKGVKK